MFFDMIKDTHVRARRLYKELNLNSLNMNSQLSAKCINEKKIFCMNIFTSYYLIFYHIQTSGTLISHYNHSTYRWAQFLRLKHAK